MTHRYRVVYSQSPGWEYAVKDRETGREVYGSNSKSEVICEAQLRNGFKPADGDEETFGKQISS